MRRAISVIAIASSALCQTPNQPVFRSASIRLNTSEGPRKLVEIGLGGVKAPNATLQQLFASACELHVSQVFGPSWISTEHYQVVAATDGATTRQQVRLALQTLLTDRFKIKSHRETKELLVYWLVVAEGGPKLRDPKEREAFEAKFAGKSPFRAGYAGLFSDKDLPGFATRLSPALDAPIIDKTGIKGHYWFELEWAFPSPSTPEPSPALESAMKEQLGLSLENHTTPMDVLIVDSAEKPTEH